MIDMDGALARLATLPVPAGLATVETAVLDRIARRPAGDTAGIGAVAGLLAVLAAATIGLAGAGVPARPARAASFGMAGAPLPSALLVDE